MTASVSKTYAPQFQLDKRNITTRALCYTISKHHNIFIAQCEKLGLVFEPQEGMRGYNDELDMYFEIFDKHKDFRLIHANNGEWYAIRSDKIMVLLS